MDKGPLVGVTVLDLSQNAAGGYCTKLLAEYGARVVKVEPPLAGDPVRHVQPFKDDLPDPETGALFLHLNTSKESITLDYTSESGKALLLQLAAGADVLVETEAPGRLAELGLDFETLQAVSPGLIVAAITPFGQDGPYAKFMGPELVAYALSGRLYETGEGHRHPIQPYGQQGHYRAGIQAAIGIVASILSPTAGTTGEYLDIAITESAAPLVGNNIFYRRNELRLRSGVRTPWAEPAARYPTTVLPCADGYVHVHGHSTDKKALANFMNEPGLLAPHLLEEPRKNADEIDALLIPWLATRTRQELFETMQSNGFPFTKVLEVDEMLTDPQNVAREAFVPVNHPVAGTMVQPAAPFKLSKAPARIGPAPRLGQDNERIYEDELGLSRADLSRLREQGVV